MASFAVKVRYAGLLQQRTRHPFTCLRRPGHYIGFGHQRIGIQSGSSRLHAKSATLDQYEGKSSNTEFSEDYLNPDKGPTDDKDMKYEHPADLERPQFHPMGQRGFVSDPCGPFYDPKHERCFPLIHSLKITKGPECESFWLLKQNNPIYDPNVIGAPRGTQPSRNSKAKYKSYVPKIAGVQCVHRYHLFFQNVPDSIEWKFGIVWGHVSSKDMVYWQHHPPALEPGKFGPEKEGFFKWDADGCFTGCATISTEGTPTILYTGVRLRNNKQAGPLPEGDDDTDLPFFECQLNAAQADLDDEYLEVWTKQDGDALADAPPKELRPAKDHTGWRDPFIFETPTEENDMQYSMLVGNGSGKLGGRALIYRSKSLTSDWKYSGTLVEAGNTETGCLWEYPVLAKLPQARKGDDGQIHFDYSNQEVGKSSAAGRDHVFLTGPDAPVNPCIYWVGTYDKGKQKFLLEDSKGPFRLDIGEILYAVNSMKCPKGRQLLWGWLQEGERDDHGYSYSGCHSLPRELMLVDDRIVQRPIEEINCLRQDNILSKEEEQELEPGKLLGLPKDAGNALDIEVTFNRGNAQQSGLLIGSWAAGGRGTCALLYDWDRKYLEAIFDTHFVCPRTADVRPLLAQYQLPHCHVRSRPLKGIKHVIPLCSQKPFSEPRKELNQRTVGGPLEPPLVEGGLKLRILLDGSCMEAFTNTGACLTTRVYRGMRPKGAPSDIGFISLGGASTVSQVNAWKMADCWIDVEEWNKSGKEPCKQCNITSATNVENDSEYGDQDVGRCKACRGLHRKGECPVFKGGYHPGESRDED